MCIDAGFTSVQTYIASGNVVFVSMAAPAKVKSELEKRLRDYCGKAVNVFVRTASELQAVLKSCPFQNTSPNHTYTIFLDEPPPRDALDQATGVNGEEMRLGAREIYVITPPAWVSRN